MATAKSLGYNKGDYCMNRNGFVCKLVQDVGTSVPLCEVWGLYHEFGGVSAGDLVGKLTKERAETLIAEMRGAGLCQ